MEKIIKKSLFQKIISTFYASKKAKIYLLIFFSVIVGLFEFFGLIFIYQFILFLINSASPYGAIVSSFFSNFLNIKNPALISLIFGISVALIYIFKNIFLLFYTKYYNKILINLSNTITIEAIKIFLYQNYLEMKSITDAQKLNLLGKIEIAVWGYSLKVINLYSNVIVAVILLSYLFLKFTIPAFITLFIVGLLGGSEFLFLRKKSNYQNENYPKALLECNSLMLKIVTLIKEIKISSKENYFINNLKEKYKTLSKLNEDKSFDGVLHIYLTEILIMFSFIVILAALFYTANFNNAVILSSLCTICVVILRLTPLINRIQSSLYVINSNKKITQDVLDFFEKYPPLKIEKTTQMQKIEFKNEILLNDLSFSYNNNSKGLKNISLKIKRGEFIGIVGESGCYKTTFLNILSGLIFPNSGNISIDGTELNLNNIKSWQNKISYITQNHGLMFENVSDNFTLFENKNPDFEKIEQVLFSLGLDKEILNMKEEELSEGQKQRVSIAVAIYQNKEVLFLDEITSSVDVVTQNKISELLNNLKNKKTIISIAHRLQVLNHCDRIIYMDKANIIDFDTFENLDKKYPEFHKIVKLSNFKIN